jgi:hypothetical protein
MAAHPKNKVTRAEQGKRRRGNTPKLLKNKATSATPLHKKGIFGRFAKAVAGAVTKPLKKAVKKKATTASKDAKGETMPAKKKTAKKATKKKAAPKKKVAKKKTAAKKKKK